MRATRSLIWLPVVCSLAGLQACGSDSTPADSGAAGALVNAGGAVATAGAHSASAGSVATGSSGAAAGGAAGAASAGASGGVDSSAGSAGSMQAAGGAGAEGGAMSSTAGSSNGGSSGAAPSGGAPSGGASAGGAGGGPTDLKALGKYVLTWYTFQDNTPVNSMFSASGHILTPFVSVAVPFTQIKNCAGETPKKGVTCGTLNYGDKLYVDFLKDRVMPNGKKHTGWVVLDDYCGDGSDDTYCYQDGGDGKKYPNVDLYLGDFSKSGMKPSGDDCSGPAGNGGQLFNLSVGNPGAAYVTDYGGAAIGTGKCGDRQVARDQQFGPPAGSPFGVDGKTDGSTTACWGYDGQGDGAADCKAMCMPGITCAK